jgi:hypothetical protein
VSSGAVIFLRRSIPLAVPRVLDQLWSLNPAKLGFMALTASTQALAVPSVSS